jgi:transcriptional regulator with XRE-family HTH domain
MMADAQGPATTRRRLRTELRRMRDEADLSQSEIVKKLDWSLSKLIRIESGTVTISITDLRALLAIYKADDDAIEDLVDLARKSRSRRWWSKFGDVLSSQYQTFIGLEAEANRLRQFHPTTVPGLLQTETYIRALLSATSLSPLSESTRESLTTVRLKRQEEILGAQEPPEFVAVIDEAALRRRVGSVRDMQSQLRHLAKMQAHDTVSIAVLPFSAGPHIGMFGAFDIMEFVDEANDPVLYLENAQGDIAMRDHSELVAQYSKHFDHILELSLQGDKAVDCIQRISGELS